ncbi:MAG: hypothetical protein JXB39_16680 [Deltaproteobacteria bacterium]|nr:hypothetical protein [Deltaproteobacteria bacterium]
MRPQSLTWYTLILSLSLAACTNEDDTGPSETDTDTDTDADVDPGVVWASERAETSELFTGVYASGQGVYATSTGGMIWTFKQSTGWRTEDAGVEEEDLNDIWGIGAGDSVEYFAVGDAGKVFHVSAGGTNNDDLGTANFEAIGGPGASLLYAVSWGGVYAWDGDVWTYESVPAAAKINDVWATVDVAIAVGENGVILRREGGTEGWQPMVSPTSNALFGVGGATIADLWAVGHNGTVINFDGTIWREYDMDEDTPGVQTITGQSLWDVWGIQNNAVYAVGNNGTAFMYDGDVWVDLPTGVDNNLYAVHGSSGFDVWAVGNRGMTIHYVGD